MTRWLPLLLVWALVACTDDPEPDFPDPPPSSAPTASASPTPSASTPTPSASETAQALTPEETVRAWVAAWNEAFATGESQNMRAFETADCRNCPALAQVIEDVYAAGGSFAGGMWTIASLGRSGKQQGQLVIGVALKVAAGATIESAGSEPNPFPADNRIARYFLVRSASEWRISAIELLS